MVVSTTSRPRLLVAAFLVFLPLLVFHRSLFLGEAFLPADQLRHLAPWRSSATPTLPWNVLRFDGITQFYPWRLELVREWREGRVPLQNPYAFAADGGTPLLANSQSAPFYPPNWLFVALGEQNVWYGFGLSAALHLLLAAVGTFRFSRTLGSSTLGALLASTVFTLSGPVTCWLALPTFLCVSAWLPWLLLAIRRAYHPQGQRAALAAAVLVGTVLLAGHLQIALYVLLTAGAYALHLGIQEGLLKRTHAARWAASVALLTVLGVGLALPQVLPAIALSRQSHRASQSRPTWADYQNWSVNALPPQSLLTLTIPDFFGHPNRNEGLYWNASQRPDGRPNLNNYAEWALYIGILPLILGCLAFGRSKFFSGLALLTLLMAFGTWLNAPFFFLVPGWSQTGNPGRVLIITAFALSLLAGLGLDALSTASRKQKAAAIGTVVGSLVVGLSLALRHANALPIPWADAVAQAQPVLTVGVVLLVLSAACLFAAPRWPQTRATILLLAILDLAFWGWGYNPSSPPKDVYPVTPGIAWLQAHAQQDLIAPLNERWSITSSAPQQVALPPNSLMVYRLHDLAGYDSLFRATSKQRISAATGSDPCPPENGNMVFIKTAEAAIALGAKYIVTSPDHEPLAGLALEYDGPDLRIYKNPQGRSAPDADRKLPPELILGLICMALSLVVLLLGLLRKQPPRR